MMWKEIKTWATNKGYKVDRKPIEGEEKKYLYSWSYNEIAGTAYSTNECATSIYNHLTSNKFVEYQQGYAQIKLSENIIIAGVAQW